MTNTINVGKDYSPIPYGRNEKFGSGNGKVFREKYIIPFLKEHIDDEQILVVDFSDIIQTPGASFLDEGFVTCVREGYISKDNFFKKIEIIEHEDYKVKEQILEYIQEC